MYSNTHQIATTYSGSLHVSFSILMLARVQLYMQLHSTAPIKILLLWLKWYHGRKHPKISYICCCVNMPLILHLHAENQTDLSCSVELSDGWIESPWYPEKNNYRIIVHIPLQNSPHATMNYPSTHRLPRAQLNDFVVKPLDMSCGINYIFVLEGRRSTTWLTKEGVFLSRPTWSANYHF
jgi:hypothetical protein